MYMTKIAAISAAALLVVGCGDRKAHEATNNTVTTGPIKPKGQGTGQTVDLVWNNGNGTWKVKLNNGSPQDPDTAKTTLAPGVGPTMFTVNISGSATFKDEGALDVWEGMNEKANPQPGINTTQILGPIITKNGKTLVFYDLNYGTGVRLNYQLNFNGTTPPVDPIIDNGGGNWN